VVDGAVVPTLGDYWGFDIEAYLSAAKRLGAEGSLYARELVEATFTPGGYDYFYYAPPFGVGLRTLSGLSVVDATNLWYFLKVGALLSACLVMPVGLRTRALVFLGAALSYWVVRDLVLGNVGVFLLLPLALTWRWLDRPLGSLTAALAISIRPSLGAILVWQLLRRRWKVAAWTIAAGIGLVLVSLPFVGFAGYQDYLTVIGNLQPPGADSESRDLGATLVNLGIDAGWLDLLRLLSLGLGLTLIVASLRWDRELGYMITLAASMLLIGQLWEHYLITLVLPLALLASRWHPLILLVLALSWLPPAFAPVPLAIVLVLLFLPAARGATDTARTLSARRPSVAS
jgi:hypothetical protein